MGKDRPMSYVIGEGNDAAKLGRLLVGLPDPRVHRYPSRASSV
jgi:hypothetical protein